MRCVRGSLYDVVVDLRAESPTYCAWYGVELSASNGRMLFVAAALRTGSRPSRTTPRCSTRCRRATRPSTRAAFAGTIPRSGSSGLTRTCARSRNATATTRTSAADTRARHRRDGLRRTPDARAARRTRLRGPRPRPARARSTRRRRDRAASSTSCGRRTSCTSRGTPSPARSGTRRRTSAGSRRASRLLDAFAESGGSRAVIAGTCAEYDWSGDGILSEQHTPLAPRTTYGEAKNALTAPRRGSSLARVGPDLLPLRAARGRAAARRLRHARAARGEPARTTHGRQVRDFLHVADVGDAFAALLDSAVGAR